MQVHDEPVDAAVAGQRVALSLPGIDRDELRRGDALIEPGSYAPSYRLDVELRELAPIPERALVHHGTSATLARVVRNGRFAQLRLAAPAIAARGDRVVLRAGTTLGGGTVIDASPPRHANADRFERAERGEQVVHGPVRAADGDWVFSDEWLDELRDRLLAAIDNADPLDPGIPAPADPWAAVVIPRLGLERRGSKLYRPGTAPTLGERERDAEALEAQLGAEPVKVPDPSLARVLEDQGRLVRVGDGYAVSPAAYEDARRTLLAELEQHGRITLARYRDLLASSRKTAQMLLERFDADGLTRRIGDERVARRSALGSTRGR